jgi:spore maturation protein SpmA
MNIIWLLIVLIDTSSTVVEFGSREACTSAANSIIQQAKASGHAGSVVLCAKQR